MSRSIGNVALWMIHCAVYVTLGTVVASTWLLPALLLFKAGPDGMLIASGAVVGYMSLAAAACLPVNFVSHSLATLIASGLAAGLAVVLLVLGNDLYALIASGNILSAFSQFSPILCVLHYVSCVLFPDQVFQIKPLQLSMVS